MKGERFLARRRSGIGGSDAAPVAGVGLWGSPLSVYLDKIGQGEEIEQTERMQWGLLLEKPVASEFATREGIARLRKPPFTRLPGLTVDGHAYWIGHPDYEGEHARDGRVVIEVKVSEVASDWMGTDADHIPFQYFLQVQHYLMLRGLEVGYLTVLIKGSELRTWRLERDNVVLGQQQDTYEEFWRNVIEHTPPEPDGSEASSRALRRMYPRDDGTERIATPEEFSYIEHVRDSRKAVRDAEATRDRWENLLKGSMRNTSRLVYEGGSVSYRNNRDSESIDWALVAASYRKALEALQAGVDFGTIEGLYSVTRQGARPLRITEKGEG